MGQNSYKLKTSEVKRIFEEISTKKIAIIGDVMLDAYTMGKVERISPEAPVPVVTCTHKESRLGGAANVALNIVAMGATPILCGVIGNDDNGTNFLKKMQDSHISNTGIFIHKGRPTTIKTRIISNSQQLLRIDEETDKALDEKHEVAYVEHLKKVLKKNQPDAIIFQDYDKGSLTPCVIEQIVAFAKEHHIHILVDPKKRNFFNYNGVSLFKPNFKEFCEGMKVELSKNDLEAIHVKALDFLKQTNTKALLLTLSEKGAFICTASEKHYLQAHIRDIADVSGAGDTVIAIASLCLSCQLPILQIAAISNLAGGLVCEKIGVVPVDCNKLEAETMLLNL